MVRLVYEHPALVTDDVRHFGDYGVPSGNRHRIIAPRREVTHDRSPTLDRFVDLDIDERPRGRSWRIRWSLRGYPNSTQWSRAIPSILERWGVMDGEVDRSQSAGLGHREHARRPTSLRRVIYRVDGCSGADVSLDVLDTDAVPEVECCRAVAEPAVDVASA